jgi:hypothetical protein
MKLSNMNSNGIVTLFLNDADGFIDTETIEVVKGIDTCRMIEIQQIFCAATSGKFRLFFNDDDGFVLNDLPFDISAKELETKMETLIPYIVDVDVSFSSTTSSSTTTTTTTTATPTSACSLTGTMITISFVVVKTTGAKNDGDLAEISVDRTNGGGDGLTHLSNRLQLANAFTEVQKGTTCIEFDQGLMIDPLKQMTSTTTMMTSDGNSASRGGSFAVSFRGFTSPPIPANALPEEVGNILQVS